MHVGSRSDIDPMVNLHKRDWTILRRNKPRNTLSSNVQGRKIIKFEKEPHSVVLIGEAVVDGFEEFEAGFRFRVL